MFVVLDPLDVVADTGVDTSVTATIAPADNADKNWLVLLVLSLVQKNEWST